MTKRIYIPKGELNEQKVEDLAVWIADRIPSPPAGQRCEDDTCHSQVDGEQPLAESFSFRIENSHICFSFVCADCQERLTAADEYIAENYPEGEGGYVLVPKHCT